MNIADIATANGYATRLAQVKQILAEGPTVATFEITTPKGSYSVALTTGEWTLGLDQIANELTQALVALGVNVS